MNSARINKLFFNILASTALTLSLCFGTFTTVTHAQSGEGVNACTYAYSDLGFHTYGECEKWLDYKAHSYLPKWQSRLNACMIYVTVGTIHQVKNELMKSNVRGAVWKFGYPLIGCLFL